MVGFPLQVDLTSLTGEAADTRTADPFDTLVSFIRNVLGLKGTKNNCAYGDTGTIHVITIILWFCCGAFSFYM